MEQRNCYTNRELSWLRFNERVLDEAGNPRVPLAERLSFAAIFQNNLDEFFMVRVGTLMTHMHASEPMRDNKTGMTSAEQVEAILKLVQELEEKKGRVYTRLMGELEPHGVRLVDFGRLSPEDGELLEELFDRQIAPFLSPMVITRQQPFPFLHNKQLCAVAWLTSKNGKNRVGIVPCTDGVVPRLIPVPSRPGTFMLREELILHFVGKLFHRYTVEQKAIMRVTRNADLDSITAIDEDLDYRDNMEQLIRQRRRLSPVRLEVSRPLPEKLRSALADFIGFREEHIIHVTTPLDLSFVSQLQEQLRGEPALFYQRRTPRMSPALDMKRSIIEQIEEKDVLLSYPFESMRPFLRLLHEAAEDETVVSIKMSLYRVADRSKVIEELIEAAENGKEVVVLLELRARFDEENNIEMSHRLEDAGCRVSYGLPEYKVHSKLCLITRYTDHGLRYLTQIGTGNYNEKTAKQYTDLSLMTADQGIGAEAARIFNAVSCEETLETTEHLLVAPHCLQNRVLELMDREIAYAKAGQRAYIGAKINSLTDKTIIDKLIEASQAGVRIELIVRGICCLRPGIEGFTDHITVISVVGRFLEHSRIYRFGVGEREQIYIASADFMTRNTLRRVEVATPIYDRDLKNRVRHIFDTIMRDDEKGRELLSDGSYTHRCINETPLNSQELFYEEAYRAAESGRVK